MRRLNKIIIIATIICTVVLILADNNLGINIKSLLNNTLALANTGDLTLINSQGEIVSDSEVGSLEDSGITGEDYNFDTVYYPYYGFLSPNEQSLYKQVYANIYELSTTFVPIVKVGSDEVKTTIEAVYNDHPELFWLDTNYSYKYTKNGNCVQIIMGFNKTADNITKSKSLFDGSAKKIIDEASKLSSNYAKEKYVHDAIIRIVDYDKNASINQSAYSALVNGKTVCAGYARAFQYIMTKLQIPTFYCVGTAGSDHAWNVVKLSDGYYNVDLTWDDYNGVSYKYFNLTDKDFSKTHIRTDLSTSLPLCTATTYAYSKSSSSNVSKNSSSSQTTNNNSNNNSNKNKDNSKSTSDNVNNSKSNDSNTTNNIDNNNSSADEVKSTNDEKTIINDNSTNNYQDDKLNTEDSLISPDSNEDNDIEKDNNN